jgi:putative FmdB family regulatory protein
MPVYEYACAACGHEFEEWQKITDPKVTKCPKCSKHKVERLISRSSFQLKGGGWYSDLYSSSKPGANGKTDSEAKTDTKSESKSENKSETKSETKSEKKKADKGKKAAAS